jgi:hypothetical protein
MPCCGENYFPPGFSRFNSRFRCAQAKNAHRVKIQYRAQTHPVGKGVFELFWSMLAAPWLMSKLRYDPRHDLPHSAIDMSGAFPDRSTCRQKSICLRYFMVVQTTQTPISSPLRYYFNNCK